MNFNNQVAIVTGASRGIGRSIAEYLADNGASVALVSRNIDQTFVTELQSKGANVLPISADVTSYDDVRKVVETTQKELGSIHILINNAGWDRTKPFMETAEEDWIKELDVNLLSQMRFCKGVIPVMQKQEYGRIINVSSDSGRVGTSNQTPYSAAKGGIIAFTKALAQEIVHHNITVNCISPGPTRTPFYQEVIDDNPGMSEGLEKAIPMGRPGEPGEVAYITSMLAAEEASYITGQTISVNGGLSMF